MTHSTLTIGSSHIMRVDALVDSDGAYVNDATVTLDSLTDLSGTAVSNVSTPVTLDYVAASNGRYQTTLSHTAGFVAENWYDATFIAVDGSVRRQWTERLKVEVGRA